MANCDKNTDGTGVCSVFIVCDTNQKPESDRKPSLLLMHSAFCHSVDPVHESW